MHLTLLACTLCGQAYDATIPQNVSSCCAKPLFAHYDLAAADLPVVTAYRAR